MKTLSLQVFILLGIVKGAAAFSHPSDPHSAVNEK